VIAALYVEKDGAYFGLPDVDPWDEERDARLYAGPWAVVAHPPCNRWSKLATFRRQRDGEDGGCFAHALGTVRRFGGVIEHPAHSLAWTRFALMRPPERGWGRSLYDDGWVCEVDQRLYGHEARKPTWLYVNGVDDPPAMLWGRGSRSAKTIQASYGGGKRQALRSRTPDDFREALLSIARSALPSFKILPAMSP
jgi:hypothetical protein